MDGRAVVPANWAVLLSDQFQPKPINLRDGGTWKFGSPPSTPSPDTQDRIEVPGALNSTLEDDACANATKMRPGDVTPCTSRPETASAVLKPFAWQMSKLDATLLSCIRGYRVVPNWKLKATGDGAAYGNFLRHTDLLKHRIPSASMP